MASYFEKGRGYRFDFLRYGRRYRSPRGFRTKKLCDAAERALRDEIEAEKAGIPRRRSTAPSFTRWAGTTYDYAVKRKHLRDPATFDRMLKKILLFWGQPPADATDRVAGAKYHDLTLDAPIRDGGWLLKFEEWMDAQQLAGSTKNHYRSACSRLYAVAMAPEYRQQTGITLNPFRGIPRDRTRRRTETFTVEQLAAIFSHASPMLVTAMKLALLSPALRVGNILALKWADIDGPWIRIAEHKTEGSTGRPLVSPIVPALAAHLEELDRDGPTVIQQGGEAIPIRQMQKAFKAAVEASGLVYGRLPGQVSFHTLRHTAATLMAELGIPDSQRRDAIGHLAIQTTQGYTHLTPLHMVAPLTQLADRLAVALAEHPPYGPPRLGEAKAKKRRAKRSRKRVKSGRK